MYVSRRQCARSWWPRSAQDAAKLQNCRTIWSSVVKQKIAATKKKERSRKIPTPSSNVGEEEGAISRCHSAELSGPACNADKGCKLVQCLGARADWFSHKPFMVPLRVSWMNWCLCPIYDELRHLGLLHIVSSHRLIWKQSNEWFLSLTLAPFACSKDTVLVYSTVSICTCTLWMWHIEPSYTLFCMKWEFNSQF